MKRVIAAIILLPFLWVWLVIPPLCLFISLWDYVTKGPSMPTVRETQTKCKDLRKHLVAWVNSRPGQWTLGVKAVRVVLGLLAAEGIHTSGEVLAKELRKAQRKGEIRKRINDDRMVEYTALPPDGMLFVVDVPRKRHA